MSKPSSVEHGRRATWRAARPSGRHRAPARQFPRSLRRRSAAAAAVVLAGSAVLGTPVTAGSSVLAATTGAAAFQRAHAGAQQTGAPTGAAAITTARIAGTPKPAAGRAAADRVSLEPPVTPDIARGSVAEAGEVLLPGRWLHTGNHRLLLTLGGDLELFTGTTKVWSSNTSGHRRARAVMQADGNLVLRTRSGKAIWSTRTSGVAGARLLVRRAAEVIVQSRAGRVAWHTTVATPTTSAKGYAIAQLSLRGWGSDQWTCLQSLWQRESGWKSTASNSGSGAYGIPQALPGSKMASAGADWRTDPQTQIRWGLGYITDRYGTPCSAWSHSESTGWY